MEIQSAAPVVIRAHLWFTRGLGVGTHMADLRGGLWKSCIYSARRSAGALMAGGLLLAACTSQMKVDRQTREVGLPRPTAVYVYTFAVDPEQVQLDRGPLARVRDAVADRSANEENEQTVALGKDIAHRFADSLVKEITAMGLTAYHVDRAQQVPPGALGVDGLFVDIDEGNRLRRMVIGFRQGQSKVGTQVHVFQSTDAGSRELLDFTATSESAPLPGGAVTMGAGAAAQVAVAAGGVKELRSSVQADAQKSSKAVAQKLQAFFAEQGWTAPPSSLPSL